MSSHRYNGSEYSDAYDRLFDRLHPFPTLGSSAIFYLLSQSQTSEHSSHPDDITMCRAILNLDLEGEEFGALITAILLHGPVSRNSHYEFRCRIYALLGLGVPER